MHPLKRNLHRKRGSRGLNSSLPKDKSARNLGMWPDLEKGLLQMCSFKFLYFERQKERDRERENQ